MGDINDYTELVKQAQLSDERALNRLAELARARLRGYVFRITLADDLTEDILQESMLEMFKFLDKLDKADRFWPWLRRIAANKINHHYARQPHQKKVSMSEIEGIPGDGGQGIVNLVGQELKQTVLAAMDQLKPRHRHVLVLRCYEEMKYADIADEMGCSEFSARRLFFRAKKALVKQLARRGLGRESLLVALVLFGKITATSEAAAAHVSVTAATVKVGAAASLAAMATTKTAMVSLAATGVIAVSSVAVVPRVEKMGWGPQETNAESFVNTPIPTKLSHEFEACWYYYPPNADGAVMMRLISNTRGRQSYCQWLQNDQANYYKRNNTITIENHRMWTSNLGVRRLPTDSPQLRDSLSRVEGVREVMDYAANSRGALLVAVKYDEDGSASQTTHHRDIADEEFFRYGWPAGARIVDNRDAMHRRGWTYFTVTGRIGAQGISGTGRLPFVYATSKRFSPWLKLQLSDGTRICDTGTGACVYDPSGQVMVRHKAGSFFKGLARPWMGLHTIDTVRRDAAEQEVWFETKPLPGRKQVEVTLDCKQVKLVYTIDMETDVIEKITFVGTNGNEGELRFSYLQDIENVGSEFAQPSRPSMRAPQREDQGVLWLVDFVDGD